MKIEDQIREQVESIYGRGSDEIGLLHLNYAARNPCRTSGLLWWIFRRWYPKSFQPMQYKIILEAETHWRFQKYYQVIP